MKDNTLYEKKYKSFNSTMTDDYRDFKFKIHSIIALLNSIESGINSAKTGIYAPDTFDVAYNSKTLIETLLDLIEQYCWLWSQIPEETLKALDMESYMKLKRSKVSESSSTESYVKVMPQAVQGLEESFIKLIERLKTRYSYETAEEFKKSMCKRYAKKRQENPKKKLDW